jgi:hypothetical protein
MVEDHRVKSGPHDFPNQKGKIAGTLRSTAGYATGSTAQSELKETTRGAAFGVSWYSFQYASTPPLVALSTFAAHLFVGMSKKYVGFLRSISLLMARPQVVA